MFNSKMVYACMVGVLLALSSAAQATATSYEFGTLITGYSGAPTSPDFGQLVATDNGGGNWSFTLSTNSNFESYFGPNAFIGAMAVDFAPPPEHPGDTIGISGVSSSVTGLTVGVSSGGGPGGDFDFRYRFGGGSTRLEGDNQYVSWNASGMVGTIEYLGLHLQSAGKDGCEKGSAWYGPISAVPEPDTYALLLAGLGLLGFTARRKKSQ
ncbi:MAG: PEP-CTERM sorting domain-containing protein [Gallionellaceae bacterium]|nr:PEP-CTERM sorting domain-containing protein [Gallionellaceae bacterium]